MMLKQVVTISDRATSGDENIFLKKNHLKCLGTTGCEAPFLPIFPAIVLSYVPDLQRNKHTNGYKDKQNPDEPKFSRPGDADETGRNR